MPKIELNTVETSYLKEIYRALEKNLEPSTGYLAKMFTVRPASAFDVLERLVQKKMVERAGWGRFKLTPRGISTASRIIHNHRVLETFFNKELGLAASDACSQAERIDYQVGELLIKKMCERLNYPHTCIHGNEVKHAKCKEG